MAGGDASFNLKSVVLFNFGTESESQLFLLGLKIKLNGKGETEQVVSFCEQIPIPRFFCSFQVKTCVSLSIVFFCKVT